MSGFPGQAIWLPLLEDTTQYWASQDLGVCRSPGDRFRLPSVLSPAPTISRRDLLNFTLDHDDPHDTSPTGLTLNFSGPIDVSNLFLPDTQETALEVVDSSGQVWPITAENYNVSSYSLNMIFDQPLPAGSYRLISPAGEGLADLAEQHVSGPLGSSGALASWSIAPQTSPRAAQDLGILWPISANQTSPINTGAFAQTTVLAPGQGEDYRWVVIVPGFYNLQTQLAGGPVAVFNIRDGISRVLDPGSTNQLNDYLMNLTDGVYTVRFVNEGSQPVTIRLGSQDRQARLGEDHQ